MTIRSLVPVAAASVVLAAAGWILPHATAQTMWDMVKVTLPYAVTIGEKTVPPGDYTIKQMESASDSSVLLIYNGTGMKFETTALTIRALDPNTPEKTSVTLHHIGDNYYLDKVWVEGKNYGYQIPLPKKVAEQEAEAAPVTVPAQTSTATADTTTTTSDTTATANADNATPPLPPPPPAEEPTPATAPTQPTPAPEPQASTDTAQSTPPPASSDDNSANREKQTDTPAMPATSAGWLAMLLSGGTLSGAGMMLRRRKP